jgi:hypothetical protein
LALPMSAFQFGATRPQTRSPPVSAILTNMSCGWMRKVLE